MKICEIIRASEWYPPRLDTNEPLPVSVILPNYNRGSTGYFEAAIKSILTQTHREFELILVEDGSDDNSMQIARRYIEIDERVGCVYHPANIGIPAISVYEAYTHARGQYISLCFNDNDFYPEALKGLLEAARAEPTKIVHGHVDFQELGRQPFELIQHKNFGSLGLPQAMLISHNFIPNPAVILDRKVLEQIGFFDPHVAITRLNDWDYWRRCSVQYEIKPVDVSVCLEKGPRLKDSLGSIHLMNLWLTEEWMRRNRNEMLQISKFEDYDIMDVPEDLSRTSREVLREISYSFRTKFWWRSPDRAIMCHVSDAKSESITRRRRSPPTLGSEIAFAAGDVSSKLSKDGQILVVTSDHGPSRSLYFDNVPGKIARRLRVIDFGSWRSRPEEMVPATAVVFCRSLSAYSDWIEYARTMQIPHYWFTDDNHFALWAENPSLEAHGEAFLIGTHRKLLSSFSGVLASTDQLRDWISDNHLHDTVSTFPPAAPLGTDFQDLSLIRPAIFTRGRTGALRIGIFAGAHRLAAFQDFIIPALISLSAEHSLDLFVVSSKPFSVEVPKRIGIHILPAETTYGLALARLRAIGIDVLIHPPTEWSGNLPYKSLNALINAAALGAIPIAGNQPPFDRLVSGEIAIVCEETTEAWIHGLGAAIDARKEGALVNRLRTYVAKHYGGAANAAVLARILDENPNPGYTTREQRYLSIKELAMRRARSEIMPTQGSEINSLIELHRERANREAAGPLERLLFLRKLAAWPPNVEPITVEQCQNLFQIRDCFGSSSDSVLRTVIAIQLVMQSATTSVAAAHSFIETLGRWNDYWDVTYSGDLRTFGYQDILLPSTGDTILGVILCLKVHPSISGRITFLLQDASGTEIDLVSRDLRTIMYLVPFLVTFRAPVKLESSNSYSLRVFPEDASDSVQILELLGRDPRRRGPKERRAYYALVADKSPEVR